MTSTTAAIVAPGDQVTPALYRGWRPESTPDCAVSITCHWAQACGASGAGVTGATFGATWILDSLPTAMCPRGRFGGASPWPVLQERFVARRRKRKGSQGLGLTEPSRRQPQETVLLPEFPSCKIRVCWQSTTRSSATALDHISRGARASLGLQWPLGERDRLWRWGWTWCWRPARGPRLHQPGERRFPPLTVLTSDRRRDQSASAG